jgi:hypothetical protein
MRRAVVAFVGLALAGVASAQAPAPDVPPGPARIEGVVLRAENGAPVTGAEVALYALTAEGVPGLRRATSDAQGRFVFEHVASDPAIGWLVGARFRGVAFPGGRVAFAPGETLAKIEVRVDEPTRDPREIRVSEQRIRLLREPGGLRVIETLALQNHAANTYYVPADARAGARPAVSSALPARASHFEMPLGVIPEGLVQHGKELRWYGPVLPGAQELSWSWTIPGATPSAANAPERFAFALHVPARTERLVLVIADPDATLEAAELSGPESVQLDGRSVRRWTLEAPPAGALPLKLSLPAARVVPGAVSVSEVRAVVQLDDAALDVSETHTLRIDGDTHVLGTVEAPLLRISLPEGAAQLRFGSDAPGLELAPHPAGGLAVIGSAAPGEARVDLAYQLAQGEPPTRLVRTLATRTPVLSIFVADTGRLAPRTERLHRRRPLRTNDLTYLHFEAFEVEAGETVELELGALPGRAQGQEKLALGLVLAAAAAAAWLLTRPLRGPLATEVDRSPAGAELGASRREREALYEAIRDLDHDHETGKVAAEDHVRLRDDLRARATALLAEERAAERSSEPVRKPGSSGRAASGGERSNTCLACGAPAEAAHRFCAHCGAALRRSEGAA